MFKSFILTYLCVNDWEKNYMVQLTSLLKNGGMMYELQKKKGVLDDDEVLIPQVGRMLYKQLKSNIDDKIKDILKSSQSGKYEISDRALETLSHFIRVARAYKDGTKVPMSTKFKE